MDESRQPKPTLCVKAGAEQSELMKIGRLIPEMTPVAIIHRGNRESDAENAEAVLSTATRTKGRGSREQATSIWRPISLIGQKDAEGIKRVARKKSANSGK